MIPTPCGAGSEKDQGSEGQQRERRGANREQREQKHFYTTFEGTHHLWWKILQ